MRNKVLTATEIEIRVATLESEINNLKEKLSEMENKPAVWWQKISGSFADDESYEEAMRLGKEYRSAQKDENDYSRH